MDNHYFRSTPDAAPTPMVGGSFAHELYGAVSDARHDLVASYLQAKNGPQEVIADEVLVDAPVTLDQTIDRLVAESYDWYITAKGQEPSAQVRGEMRAAAGKEAARLHNIELAPLADTYDVDSRQQVNPELNATIEQAPSKRPGLRQRLGAFVAKLTTKKPDAVRPKPAVVHNATAWSASAEKSHRHRHTAIVVAGVLALGASLVGLQHAANTVQPQEAAPTVTAPTTTPETSVTVQTPAANEAVTPATTPVSIPMEITKGASLTSLTRAALSKSGYQVSDHQAYQTVIKMDQAKHLQVAFPGTRIYHQNGDPRLGGHGTTAANVSQVVADFLTLPA